MRFNRRVQRQYQTSRAPGAYGVRAGTRIFGNESRPRVFWLGGVGRTGGMETRTAGGSMRNSRGTIVCTVPERPHSAGILLTKQYTFFNNKIFSLHPHPASWPKRYVFRSRVRSPGTQRNLFSGQVLGCDSAAHYTPNRQTNGALRPEFWWWETFLERNVFVPITSFAGTKVRQSSFKIISLFVFSKTV